jgi:hypothetical protein
MAEQGLPWKVEARYDPFPDLPEPTFLRRAAADEAERLPVWGYSARNGFLAWLQIGVPKAFAVSETGNFWASAWGVARPMAEALKHCEDVSGARCRLFAVNGHVVGARSSGTD